MTYNFVVKVKMAPNIFDPQAITIERSLKKMAYPIKKIEIGKSFALSIESDSEKNAVKIVTEIAERMLSNPVLEVFELEQTEK